MQELDLEFYSREVLVEAYPYVRRPGQPKSDHLQICLCCLVVVLNGDMAGGYQSETHDMAGVGEVLGERGGVLLVVEGEAAA